jgi:hypothetical protein
MARDRDVRNAIASALEASGFFDAVITTGLRKLDDQAAEDLRAVSIQPVSSTQSDTWDAPVAAYVQVDSTVRLIFVVRAQDEQTRDDTVELLLMHAQDLLNGQILAGITLPEWTKFTSYTWEDPTPPERKITAAFAYRYLVSGWNSFDTTTP